MNLQTLKASSPVWTKQSSTSEVTSLDLEFSFLGRAAASSAPLAGCGARLLVWRALPALHLPCCSGVPAWLMLAGMRRPHPAAPPLKLRRGVAAGEAAGAGKALAVVRKLLTSAQLEEGLAPMWVTPETGDFSGRPGLWRPAGLQTSLH